MIYFTYNSLAQLTIMIIANLKFFIEHTLDVDLRLSIQTRGPIGLYRSPGFAIYIPLSNYDQRMLHAKYLSIYWAPKGATPFI